MERDRERATKVREREMNTASFKRKWKWKRGSEKTQLMYADCVGNRKCAKDAPSKTVKIFKNILVKILADLVK